MFFWQNVNLNYMVTFVPKNITVTYYASTSDQERQSRGSKLYEKIIIYLVS